ncbi:MAG: two-component system, OmpR family, phosphate regulon sensor histidine kinase PhoR, partial [Parcubacteria group bacterium Gr01-1014_72]
AGSGAVKEEQKIFDIIKQSNERLILLVEDILEAARIEGQVVQIETTPTSVPRAVEEALGELASEAEARGVSVETMMPSDLPTVMADAVRLKEVFINLLSNAVKYSNERTRRVRITAHREGNEVIVGVVNDGAGIKPEDQPHVFEKFWRARDTFASQQGTGLGLFIVKELVSRMAGRVFFTSRSGETVFSVAFRVAS